MNPITDYLLWFFLYSVIGWIYETILVSIEEKKIVNRGFLTGPYCPIYGVGAVVNYALFHSLTNPLLLFLASAFCACSIEYFTSWLLEKLFHARWWDYTGQFMNLNGRVFLLGFFGFGVMSLGVIRWVHPAVIEWTTSLNPAVYYMLIGGIVTLLSIDTVTTVAQLRFFNKKLAALESSLNQRLYDGLTSLEERKSALEEDLSKVRKDLSEGQSLQSAVSNLNLKERILLSPGTHFRSLRHPEVVDKLKGRFQSVKESARRARRAAKHHKKRSDKNP
ncbi:hypothetical protein ABB02_01648 [Clostridiaceae bacterium JG1575]|nr:hypothetical protein ABB02_01648 [Clostridiaceae bacterium JG1575]